MNNHKSKSSTLCHTYIHPRIDKKTTSQKVLHLKISMHITDHKSRSWQNVFNMMVVKEGVITKHFKFKVMYVWSETIESKKLNIWSLCLRKYIYNPSVESRSSMWGWISHLDINSCRKNGWNDMINCKCQLLWCRPLQKCQLLIVEYECVALVTSVLLSWTRRLNGPNSTRIDLP
jgi:hypothetical protein